jgi:hypothetical protein
MTTSQSSIKSAVKAAAGRLAVKGHFKPKHGYAHPGNKTYNVWSCMVQRCYNPNHKSYARYGGRGISVCEAWRNDFAAFLADMGEVQPGLSLGRINNDLGYSKENSRWETMKEQQNNRSSNRLLAARGKCMTLGQWAELTGTLACTIARRLDKSQWPVEDAIFTPVRSRTRWSKAD